MVTEFTLRSALAGGALIALSTLAGCISPLKSPQDEPAWHAVDGNKARHHMQLMADQLMQLTILTMQDSPADTERQMNDKRLQVLGWLNQIEQEARQVGPSFMGAFLEDVSLARQFARQEPPNLVPANRLVKSCLACHQSLQPAGL